MPVINRSKHRWIVTRVIMADTFWKRIKGWVGLCKFDPEAALWVKPCWGVHTIGMHFPVDLLFLGKNHRVLKTIPNLQKNRISPFVLQSRSVLVLPVYTVVKSRTTVGDIIDITTEGQELESHLGDQDLPNYQQQP